MKNVIKEMDIDKLSEKEQIEFYKKHFKYQHCEYNDCGSEVRETWVLSNGDLFCDNCFDLYKQEAIFEVENEVKNLEEKLSEAKLRLHELK